MLRLVIENNSVIMVVKEVAMKIGARTIKTAIAVFIVLTVFEAMGWESPFYAAIAAVIGMQNTIENAYEVSINRMIGTVIGGFIGLVLTILLGTASWVCALGIVLTIATCQYFGKSNAVVISCIVVIAIMTNLQDEAAHYYAIYRVIETFIGLVIAIIVNRFVKIEKLAMFDHKKN